MSPFPMIKEIEAVQDPRAAELLLHPLRQRILREAVEDTSAAEIARRVDLPPQKVNYHVRTLVNAGLLVPAGQRLRRNLVEKRYRASARSYVLMPSVLGQMSPEQRRVADEYSASHLLQLISTVQAELGAVIQEAAHEGGDLPTLSLDAELRFESREQRADFARTLRAAITDVIGRFTAPALDDGGVARPGRPYRLAVGCYPVAARGGGPGASHLDHESRANQRRPE